MWLFDQTGVFELSHHVANRRRTPAVAMRKTVGEHARANCLAGDEVFFDQGCEEYFRSRINRALLGTLKICGSSGHWLAVYKVILRLHRLPPIGCLCVICGWL